VTPKLLLTVIAALAIAIGFALPGPHPTHNPPKAQIPMQEIGRS
jgi:hypothetical protein